MMTRRFISLFPFFLYCPRPCPFFFFFNDTATTEIYTLSLHDALPISKRPTFSGASSHSDVLPLRTAAVWRCRSEEHTSELQSPCNLVCRLLLEKKKKTHETRLSAINHTARTSHHIGTVSSVVSLVQSA